MSTGAIIALFFMIAGIILWMKPKDTEEDNTEDPRSILKRELKEEILAELREEFIVVPLDKLSETD